MISLVLFIVGIYVFLNNPRYYSDLHENVIKSSKPGSYYKDRNKLVVALSKVSSIPPPVPPNNSCKPPPLPKIPSCKNETGLNGERLNKQRKLAWMLLFSFEADTLEIAFYELLDLIDFIFIVEATKTHKGVRNSWPVRFN